MDCNRTVGVPNTVWLPFGIDVHLHRTTPRISERDDPAAFINDNDLVNGNIAQNLMLAGGPINLDRVYFVVRGQAEVQTRILCRTVTHTALSLVVADEISCRKLHTSARAVAIAARANQMNL